METMGLTQRKHMAKHITYLKTKKISMQPFLWCSKPSLAGRRKFSSKKDLHLSSNLSRPKPPFRLSLSTSFPVKNFSLTLSIKEGVYILVAFFINSFVCGFVLVVSEVSLWTDHCIYIQHVAPDGTGHFHHSIDVTCILPDTFFRVHLSALFVVSVVPNPAYFDLVHEIFRPHSTIPSELKDHGLGSV